MIYFIGEKRSEQAIRNNWHWDDNVSTAKYLLDCLSVVGIYQEDIIFRNLWSDDGILQKSVIEDLKNTDLKIVGMGEKVSKELEKYNIHFTQIIHPAARGSIRKRENYIRHLEDRLLLAWW